MPQGLALLVFGSASALASAPPEADFISSVARCASTLAERDDFAGSVAVGRRDEILFSRAYGDAGPGRGPTSATTPHNIGSINKMFTAVAIAQLVDSGRLAFDDPVGRHLPDLPQEIGSVTIEQLLTHRSGLGDFFRIENGETIASARTARDLVGIAIAGGLRFEPGTRRAYSNSGFILLGAVIEQLSGKTYSDYVQEKVFTPAGMTETSMERPADAGTPMTRLGLNENGGPAGGRRPAPVMGGGRSSPAGGAYSTAADLVRFAGALVANRLTRPESTAALIRLTRASTAGSAADGQSYGLGFNLWRVNGIAFAGHGGGTPGVNAEVSFDADGVAVAALSHYDPPSASQITAFARHVLAHPGEPADQALCGTLAAAPPGMAPRLIEPQSSVRSQAE